jgi:hypothetical protein
MARRAASSPEISLFPFLSILVCVIGALVLLIVIMTLGQTTAGDGRTQEEMQRAMKHQSLTRQLPELAAQLEKREKESGTSGRLLAQLKQKQSLLLNLPTEFKKLAPEKDPAQTDAELQKRLELAMQQLAAMAKETPELQKEIAKLEAELAAANKKLKAPPALIVEPGGTGNARNAALFFVEAGGGGIVLHEKKAEPVRISNGSIGTDETLNKFFLTAQKNPKALVLFLIREDGNGSYVKAAGYAESQFKLRTGKLPLPGQGKVDLSKFGLTDN